MIKLHKACKENDIETLRRLLAELQGKELINQEERYNNGLRPIHYACKEGCHFSVLERGF
ncbi:MAG: ankyrin repeat domain-containing protein [Thermoproteota archaeon]